MNISTKAYNNAILNLKECKNRSRYLLSYPMKLYIEPTFACNLCCKYCYPHDQRVTEMLDMNLFYSIEKQLFDNLCEVNLFLRGEPTLYKHFPEMLDICSKYSFITKFFSNLSYDNNLILEKIVAAGSFLVVSFDGFGENTLREGSDPDKIIRNIKFLQKCQKESGNEKFHIRNAMVVGKNNVQSLCQMVEWVHSMGIKELELCCLDTSDNTNNYKLTAEDAPCFDKAVKRADELNIRISTPTHIGGIKLEKTSNWEEFTLPIDNYFPHFLEDCNPDVNTKFCPYPWVHTIIELDGTVVSCCPRRQTMGKFTTETNFINSIWNNDKYVKLRSVKDYTSCKSSDNFECNMIKFSILGGERRLNNIPKTI